jgi:hypothetical protein
MSRAEFCLETVPFPRGIRPIRCCPGAIRGRSRPIGGGLGAELLQLAQQ